WDSWRDEYLVSLREQQCMMHREPRNAVSREPKKGEMVIIQDEKIPRGHWKMGLITKIQRSEHNHIGSVRLKTPTNQNLERPISQLFPLEIRGPVEPNDSE
ncbi:hypothetical protein Tcan_01213, partial [Toxocara canis]